MSTLSIYKNTLLYGLDNFQEGLLDDAVGGDDAVARYTDDFADVRDVHDFQYLAFGVT